MLGPIMAQIVTFKPAQHHAVIAEQTGAADFLGRRPPRGAEGPGVADLSRAPHRHTDGDDARHEAARHPEPGAALEEGGPKGVERQPTPEASGEKENTPS